MKRQLVGRRFLLAAVTAMVIVNNVPATAEANDPCSYGDARALFETFPLTFDGTPPPCQFRLFWDGRTLRFTEDDFFLGGFVRRQSFGAQVSRDQAVAILESTTIRIWLAEVTPSGVGPMVEQLVDRTEIKSANDTSSGQHVWAQWGVINQLPPGEYVAVSDLPTAGGGRARSTVRLVINPTS